MCLPSKNHHHIVPVCFQAIAGCFYIGSELFSLFCVCVFLGGCEGGGQGFAVKYGFECILSGEIVC